MKEKDVENAILDYLAMVPQAKFWKIDVTGIFDPVSKRFRKRSSRHRYRGVSDIIGFYKNRFVAIEVKAPNKKNNLTLYQKEFLEACAENGHISIVATSVKEVADVLVKL